MIDLHRLLNLSHNHQQSQIPKFQQPQLRCPSGNLITRICINDSCPTSIICNQIHCSSCGVKVHPTCPSVSLQGITELLNERVSYSEEVKAQISQIDSDFMQALLQAQKALMNTVILDNLQPQDQRTIRQIYRRKNIEVLTGGSARQFCQRLKYKNIELEQSTRKAISNYRQSIATMKEEMIYIKKSLIQALKNKVSRKDPTLMNLESKILSAQDQETFQQKQFLSQILSFPKRIELLYRASQHKFSAEKFHKECDNIPNSLVLVKTEYGKIIGGFTKYPWNSKNQPISNSGKQSFLFSLTLLEKMTPQHKTSLIWGKEGFGPIFGDGHDLCIADQCNINRDSFTNFPYTYNTEGINRYVSNQRSYQAFSGSTNDINFLVQEYEIFSVFWDEKTQKCSECQLQ